MKLDASVRLIVLQFSFKNKKAVPVTVVKCRPETEEEHTARKSRATGVQIMEPTMDCSLEHFLAEIEAAGYELVGATYQERVDPKDQFRKVHHCVRYVFARHECAVIKEKLFLAIRNDIRAELQHTVATTMWRVRAYRNPYHVRGEDVPGVDTLSVNLEVRTPLFRSDGELVTVWEKDKYGQRVGEKPLPLKVSHYLRVQENQVSLVAS